jgi:FAD/FMN-containing dehydrogenase/Fe-S oxidoreductase
VLDYDPVGHTITVRPGISIDAVNRYLDTQAGETDGEWFFAPDPATVAQCTIGGCIGNNAAGARSLRYGRTSENLSGVEVILSDGARVWLEPNAGKADALARDLAAGVLAVVRRHAGEIRRRFPKLNRRNAGYALDLILDQVDAGATADTLDLAPLLCGSEGTLAVIAAARLKLHPKPKRRGLAILSFPSLEEAIETVVPLLRSDPTAVELLDDTVLTAAAANAGCRPYLDVIPLIAGKLPAAALYVELFEENGPSIEEQFSTLPADAVRTANFITSASEMNRAWALRKAGEPLLHGLSAHRKPQTFIEDNSVPVENLSRFVREVKRIVADHGTAAAFYAHAGPGVLHVRPMLDLHDPEDKTRMRSIAVAVADLARDCGGVMSGEHGDGRVRGPLLERYFGTEIMSAFAAVKSLFDQVGILNPGMIVGAGAIETITTSLRVDSVQQRLVDTFYSYDDQEGFYGAIEMCNGAGVCRKTAGGTMCPSYRGTLEERHSTRGRGNALRLAISGQLRRDPNGTPDFADAGTIETLDLCLSCKACKSECPSNVDVARLKAEYTAQRYRDTGVPFSTRLIGNVRTLNRIACVVPRLSNAAATNVYVRRVVNRVLGFAEGRSLPRFARRLSQRQLKGRVRPDAPVVVLFGDCFTTCNDPNIGRAAARVLNALGYAVRFADAGCCGRAMMSLGMLSDAITTADRTLAKLRGDIEDPRVAAIVVAEPSCLASFKDDWLQLKLTSPKVLREQLAAKSFLVEEFVETHWAAHPWRPAVAPYAGPPVVLHGHCHQKALWGDSTSGDALRRFAGVKLTTLPTGCCGMAGTFGYAAERYALSMRIAGLDLLPRLRAAGDAIVVAPGTSCRHQIKDGAGRASLHPIEFIDRCLHDGAPPRHSGVAPAHHPA